VYLSGYVQEAGRKKKRKKKEQMSMRLLDSMHACIHLLSN